MTIAEEAKRAASAAHILAAMPAEQKNAALLRFAAALRAAAPAIAAENAQDVAQSEAEGLAAPLLKRLSFGEKKIADAALGVESVAALPDPVGKTLLSRELAPGLDLYRVACPIGVVGVIFESRPDALVQIASLCLKSGNACLLKGGREALRTNRVVTAVLQQAAKEAGLPEGFMTLLESRADVDEMLICDREIDLIIPRGSNAFVRYIMERSRIPVMGHSEGICHIYVDKSADFEQALTVIADAKTQAPATCNTCETLLVDRAAAMEFLPRLGETLGALAVTLRGDGETRALIHCEEATEADWSAEYLDKVLAIKVVGGVEEAVAHINTYGSRHTDAILATDQAAVDRFISLVDTGSVMVNCSTRFSDGFRYGFGAEVGISTSKLHARGPVGLEGLCSYKYILLGSGQTVAEFAEGRAQFTHRELEGNYPAVQ